MLEFIWNHVWAMIGVGGIAILVAVAVAYFIPGLRLVALEVIGGILAAGAIYAKGAADAHRSDKERQDKAEAKSIADAKADRAAADRDLANGVSDGGNRDQ